MSVSTTRTRTATLKLKDRDARGENLNITVKILYPGISTVVENELERRMLMVADKEKDGPFADWALRPILKMVICAMQIKSLTDWIEDKPEMSTDGEEEEEEDKDKRIES